MPAMTSVGAASALRKKTGAVTPYRVRSWRTIDTRHRDVRDDQIGRILFGLLEALDAIPRNHDLVLTTEELGQNVATIRLILDDQDAFSQRRRCFWAHVSG
jgi:hypothetical protein